MVTILTAPPSTPFPVIDECKEEIIEQTDDSSCNIVLSSARNITCSVSGYFPSITLSFRHSSLSVETLASREETNSDGTRNKSVTITADLSTEPYVCVASDIPGSGDQERETSIFLYAPSPSSTSTVIAISTEKNEGSSSPQIIGQYLQ